MTIEERADAYCKEIFTHYEYMKPRTESLAKACYIDGATEQKAVDIETIPQLYVRWLMIDGEKPTWEEYANKAMEE